jgi:hypothetical protein
LVIQEAVLVFGKWLCGKQDMLKGSEITEIIVDDDSDFELDVKNSDRD